MLQLQKGIGLIEVLVTIVITAVGLLGLSAMQMQSVRSAEDSGNRSHAIWMANDLINRMRANEVQNYDTNGVVLSCNAIPDNLTICGEYHDGSNAIAPANCSNAEQAVFDRWEVLCGMAAAVDGTAAVTSSASFINNPGLQITTLANQDVQMTISWDSRTSGTDAEGVQRFMIDENNASAVQRESYVTVFRP